MRELLHIKCSGTPKLNATVVHPKRRTENVLSLASSANSTSHQRLPTADLTGDINAVSAAAVPSQPKCSACCHAAAHCFRTAPSSGNTLCQLPNRNARHIRFYGAHGSLTECKSCQMSHRMFRARACADDRALFCRIHRSSRYLSGSEFAAGSANCGNAA